MKRAARIGLALVVVLFLLGAGARWYLTSRQLANSVSTRIAEVYGGDVQVDAIDIWVGNSSFSGIRLFEKDCPAGDGDPWLVVESIQTDLSVFDLIAGRFTPSQVKLDGARVLLRFDEKGRLLTCLPDQLFAAHDPETPSLIEGLPQINLLNSQVTLRRADGDLALENINATLGQEQDRFVLAGAVESSQWGKWTLSGEAVQGSSQFQVVLRSHDAVDVNQEMLDRIPFISPDILAAIQIQSGKTTGRLEFSHDLAADSVHYRIELEPRETNLTVRAIDLNASAAQGKVMIEDGVILLRDVSGTVFEGNLRADADLDFRKDITQLRFDRVEAAQGQGLRVEQFPKSWKFPPKITGRLEGSASLQVSIIPETPETTARVQTQGVGKGQIVDAMVAGRPTERPVGLELHPVPGGFGFGVKGSEASWKNPPALNHPAPLDIPADLDALAALLAMNSTLLPPHAPAPVALRDENKDEPGKGKTTYFDIDLSMKDLDVSTFAQDLEFELPFELVGTLSFQVKISIPVDQTGDLKLYRIHGTAQLRDFVLGDLKLDHLETEVSFTDGVLRMPTLQGRMPADPIFKDKKAGTFAGAGTFQVEPLGDLKASLSFERIPLSQAAKLSGAEEPIQGEISGTVEAVVPGKDLNDPRAWTVHAKFASERVLAFGWNLQGASALMRVEKGALNLDKLQARLEGAAITASAQLALDGAYPFTGQIAIAEADLAALQRLTPDLRPPVKIAGRLQTTVALEGTGAPFEVRASGATEASNLQVEQFTLKNAHVAWELFPDRLDLKKVQAELYDGRVSGVAVIPIAPKAAGAVDIQIQGLDAAALARSIPAMPVRIQGNVDGRIKGTLPPMEPGQERKVAFVLDLTAPKLRVQNVPTEQLQGALEYRGGVVDYRLQGRMAKGSYELKGQIPAPEEKQDAGAGRLRISGVHISHLLAGLGMGDGARLYEGVLNVELNYTHPPGQVFPEGAGRVRISNLRYKDTLLATELVGDVTLRNQRLQLRDFSTTFGEGIIRAEVHLDLRRPDLSWFTLNMDRVEASRLLGPWLGETLKGHLQARIRGKLGREWSGTAELEMARAQIAGLEATQWRMPVHFRFSPGAGRGEIRVYDTTAQIGAGRVTGKVTYAWAFAARVEGQLRFTRVNVETLMRDVYGPSRVAGGLMTGRFDFAGRDMRSVNDLTGIFESAFEQSQALNLPVLRQVSPLLGVNPNTTFQKGEVRARLGNGFFRIERFGMEGRNGSLFIQGTLSLAGRLDLDVQAVTANLLGVDPRLAALGLRIPLLGPMPVGLALQAGELLSNRVIHLRVTGTTRSPNIRVLPLATLSQEGIRYFLRRSSPLRLNP